MGHLTPVVCVHGIATIFYYTVYGEAGFTPPCSSLLSSPLPTADGDTTLLHCRNFSLSTLHPFIRVHFLFFFFLV
ncbi:hypothetical protein L6452_37855 [Arctium lappa]|uniref:Uncharacterized protein n=1 Tax=Arctium lappa TaxID=4217 RepID=A0ACB8Y594_ARCLA|nr:hypothetical protein L6452_37855 [Arctium lappa]